MHPWRAQPETANRKDAKAKRMDAMPKRFDWWTVVHLMNVCLHHREQKMRRLPSATQAQAKAKVPKKSLIKRACRPKSTEAMEPLHGSRPLLLGQGGAIVAQAVLQPAHDLHVAALNSPAHTPPCAHLVELQRIAHGVTGTGGDDAVVTSRLSLCPSNGLLLGKGVLDEIVAAVSAAAAAFGGPGVACGVG